MDPIARNLASALIAIGAAVLAGAAAAETRDRLHIVGSSTVYPYTNAVADRFAQAGRFLRPDIESTGTGGGFERFCVGSGLNTPDITGASRPMRLEEWEACRANGVWPITEVPIGYDGLTLAVSKSSPDTFSLTLKDLYTALAAQVPVDGALVDNPHKAWSDVRPDLPDAPISVIGPPATSGTRDSFVELALHVGCRHYGALVRLEASDPAAWQAVCSTIRTDGAYIEAGEDDEAIVADIEKAPHTLGIMGYGYLFEHEATLKGVPIEGVTPDFGTISTLDYPLARPLFIYLKNQHASAIPGMSEFVREYVSGMDPSGYLFALGLVPYFEFVDFEQVAGDAIDGRPMRPPTH
ncbi:substrate-binding domain-containing protein [Acuticoccus kandeliae]|uniref:substrate-binding domain-containing protein n=1 Tax=Acuticoccus kandeliae TaxID=2073160 RepID=UPI000D3E71AC|nr:substrate-binding domain-containing protein [Acuticoccus kandeliae]